MSVRKKHSEFYRIKTFFLTPIIHRLPDLIPLSFFFFLLLYSTAQHTLKHVRLTAATRLNDASWRSGRRWLGQRGKLRALPLGHLGHFRALTFHQLVQAGNLLEPIDGVDGSHSLGQVHVIRQSSGQVGQQGLEGAEAVRGDGIHNAFEVPVSVPVEAHFLGLLLRAEGLQRAGSVKAAVGAVRGAGQPVHPRPSAVPLRLVPLIKVLQLHVSAEGHDGVKVEPMRQKKAKQRSI